MWLNDVKFPFYLIFHPFEGFWELKYERKGKPAIAMALLLLLTVTLVLRRQEDGFLVNFTNLNHVNSLDELKFVIVPFLLWCVANWSLTTLMDGEGKFKEIALATGYALLPFIVIYAPLIVMSNYITQEETAFYYFFNSLAFVWFAWLLFIGTMTVHQYTVTKTFVTMLLTFVVMGVIIFLGLLFFSLIQQILSFVLTIYQELSLRS